MPFLVLLGAWVAEGAGGSGDYAGGDSPLTWD